MNTLRKRVQGLIDKHDVDSYRASVGAEHSSYPSAAVTADRILALVAEALLREAMMSEDAAEPASAWDQYGYSLGEPDEDVRELMRIATAGITQDKAYD